MKTVKQLLWFVVPTGVIWSLLYAWMLLPDGNLPKFMDKGQYIKLFFHDPLLLKALTNSLLGPLLIALIIGSVFYMANLVLSKKANKAVFDKVFYTVVFVICSAVFYLLANRVTTKSLFAALAYTYSINLFLILMSLQVGIVMCFLFWCADKTMGKIKASSR